MDDLELIKENVQPLRSGRKIDSLKAALNMDSNETKKREETRLQFEKDLELVKDRELFEKYYNYISWIEQNYPDGGKEANLIGILEKCIQLFYDDENYKNDEKFLTIFLKYVDSISDPLNVFNFFYKAKFAKKLALFYINWSYYLELENNYEKALKVIKVGIKNEAEPIEELNRTLNDLQVRTMRFVCSNQNDDKNSKRKALNNLKAKHDSKGKAVAPINRAGTNVKTNTGLKTTETNSNVKNECINIYCDENEPETSSNTNIPITRLQNHNQENEQKPEKWSENKLKLKKGLSKPVQEFEIYVESNENTEKTEKVNIKPTSTSSSNSSFPVALFENKNILEKYIWHNKLHEIYKENTEYSFEELRYQKWLINKSEMKSEEFKEESEGVTTIVRGFFNGTLANTVEKSFFSNLEKSNMTTEIDNVKENFEIFAEPSIYTKNEQDLQPVSNKFPEKNEITISDTTISGLKDANFNLFSSSTPIVNKTLMRMSNMAVRSFNNPNFVNGITSKLSTIVETSREEYSKSSSSSSGTSSSTVSNTQRKLFTNCENIDPFDLNLKSSLLCSLTDPVEFRKGFIKLQKPLPEFVNFKKYIIEQDFYLTFEQVSSNNSVETYLVFKSSSNFDVIQDTRICLLKICKELNFWEFYIYNELERRLIQNRQNPDIEFSVMSLNKIVFYNNGSITINDLETKWTLKHILNCLGKSKQKLPRTLSYLLILELIIIIQQIHECGIIHGNLIPENITFNNFNSDDIELLPKRTTAFQIVDFSMAIDMKLFPEGTVFNKNYKKEPLYDILNKMNWTYEIDWIAFVNCIHLIIFGSNMKILSEGSKFTVEKKLDPNEYALISDLFDVLINMETNHKPNLSKYIDNLASYLHNNKWSLKEDLSFLKNVIYYS